MAEPNKEQLKVQLAEAVANVEALTKELAALKDAKPEAAEALAMVEELSKELEAIKATNDSRTSLEPVTFPESLILTVSEAAALSADDQARFRHAGGTVTNDPQQD